MKGCAPRRAVVLSGGGARGAYEAGVLRYLLEVLPARLGRAPRFDIVCGTSVGAIHACFLAATAHLGPERGARLAAVWRDMRLGSFFGSALQEALHLPRRLLGLLRAPDFLRTGRPPERLYGLLETERLERLVLDSIPWSSIASNLRRGALDAVCVAATEIATGRVAVFVESRDGRELAWPQDASMVGVPVTLAAEHALASAAIPLLFPAVRVGGGYYADGGLRLNTPLAPALRLGADRVLVVALRHGAAVGEEAALALRRIEHFGNPLFLFGKILNALLLDHVDTDLDRMHLTNDLLRRAAAAGGPAILDAMNEGVEGGAPAFRIVDDLVIRPSQDLGWLAGEAVREEGGRVRADLAGLLLRALGVGDDSFEADLLSYIFFDSSYTATLLELGFGDAQAQEEELVRFFTD